MKKMCNNENYACGTDGVVLVKEDSTDLNHLPGYMANKIYIMYVMINKAHQYIDTDVSSSESSLR